MISQRISLTWLLITTVFLVFIFYSIAAIKAPAVAFRAHEDLLQMAEKHTSLEKNHFKLRSRIDSARDMLAINLASERVAIQEVFDAATWVDQRVKKLTLKTNHKPQKKTLLSLEKTLRFLLKESAFGTEFEHDDDAQNAEVLIRQYLQEFHINLVKSVTGLKADEIEITKFNVDYDFLISTLNAYFRQPPNYRLDIRTLLLEQKNHIETLTANETTYNKGYFDVKKLKEIHNKVHFLTMQYYELFDETDLQSDTMISLVDKLTATWEQYEYFLSGQKHKINALIKERSYQLSRQVEKEGNNLYWLLLTGAALIFINLSIFFIIAYMRLSGLRTAALSIADGETTPALIKESKSNDFISTITKAFNTMVQSLINREKEIHQYVTELSNHGEKLENEVKSRTKELSMKNKQLVEEVQLRKINEERLKISDLALANTSEAVLITNAQLEIIDVNPSYCNLTGFSKEEILGESPCFDRSGQHDDGFYQELWKTLNKKGHWSGEIINRRKSGEIFPIWETINAVTNTGGEIINYVGVFRDISDLKEVEKKLHNMAYHDHLTKLPNRSLFHEHLNHELDIAKRNEGKIAVLFIDLDRFKIINDTLGHEAGDQLLIEVSERLHKSIRESDIVARQGGDEFLILLRDIETIEMTASIAKNIIDRLKMPFYLSGTEAYIGSSVGISVYPDDGDNVEQLIKNGDIAMYHAKENGKGRYEFFNELMNEKNQKRQQIEHRLSIAIEKKAFTLHIQPQVNHEGVISGAEALLRWNDDVLGMVPPDLFIPIAEESGQIYEIGQQVVEMVCKSIHIMKSSNLPKFLVSLNLSSKELLNAGFVSNLSNNLKSFGVTPQEIELEVTETALLDNIEDAKATLTQLAKLGFTLALDDFGTGYSSLAYLHQLPFDRLKIDRSFISNIPEDPNSIAISKTILGFAQAMDMQVVAEGVETQQQQAFLWENNCDYCQGYKISRPLPINDFIDFVQNHVIDTVAT